MKTVLYLGFIFFLFYSVFSDNPIVINWSTGICIYLLSKWIFNYHKCTLSYLECKARNVKKGEGYINNFLEPVIHLNKTYWNLKIIVYTFVIVVLTINIRKKYTI